MEKVDTNDKIMKPISIAPEDITFSDVVQGKTYETQIQLTNNLKFLISISIKCSWSDKLQISPREFKLGSQKSQTVSISLKMNKPFGEKGGKKVPIKEWLFIKSDHFDQKVRILINPENWYQLAEKYLSNLSQSNENSVVQNEISNEDFENMLEEGRDMDDHAFDNQVEGCEWEEQKQSFPRSSESSSEQRPSPGFEYSSFNPSAFKQQKSSEGEQEPLHQQIERLKFVCNKQEIELEEYRKQTSYIDQVKRILSEKEPSLNKLVDLALKQERLKNEQKSQKIVCILNRKDKTIEELKLKVQQYSQSSTVLQKEIEKFEEYRQKTAEELNQKLCLFKLNNKGHDVQSIVEYKEEIDKLTSALESQLEEVSNFKIVVASLEETNHSLLLNLEQSQNASKEKDGIISRMEQKLINLEEENESHKLKINNLVEKVTSLAEENSKSFSERSKNINKEESYVSKISSISEEMNRVKEEKSELEREINSVKEIHLSFLESCNQAIHPGMKIGDDYDIEFVQNGIVNNIEDMRNSIENYQKRHEQDQECLQQTEREIQKIQHRLAGKSYSSKFVQTESNGNDIMDLGQRISELENAYDTVMEENKELIEYAKNLDQEVNELSRQKDYFQKEFENIKNKNHIKSTSSLAYSDEENNENFWNKERGVFGRDQVQRATHPHCWAKKGNWTAEESHSEFRK
jgi:hypothetical protein